MKNLFYALSIASMAFLTGCVSSKTPAGDWTLVDYTINSTQQNVIPSTLIVSETSSASVEVLGFSGVNTYSAVYKVDGNSITLHNQIASTKMAGSAAAMQFEEAYLCSLEKADKWVLEHKNGVEVLTISNSTENSSLSFIRYSLLGTVWKVIELTDDAPSISITCQPEVAFNSNGIASCFTGLNYFTSRARFDAEKHTISFSDGAITLMDGPEVENLIEQCFVRSLALTQSYSFDGKYLTFRGEDGIKTMVLERSN